MKAMQYSLVSALVVVLCVVGAVSGATSPRKLLNEPLTISNSNNRQLSSAAGVPGNCNGLINPTAFIQSNVDGTNSVLGSVSLSNPSPVPLSLSSIKVTVANNIAFRPMFIDADCHGATAVSAFSSITCNYSAVLPTQGTSANPNVWTGVVASAKVGQNGGVTCSSPSVSIINTAGSSLLMSASG